MNRSPSGAEYAALPAGGLGDERAGRVLGLDEPGWVKLHELGIANPASGVHCEPERVAGVLVATRRGVTPDPRVAAGGEDDRVSVDDVTGPLTQVEAVRAEDDVVADEEPRDVSGVEDRHVQLRDTVEERPLDLEARVVAGERGAAEGVRTEEALRDPPVLLAVEPHAVSFEVVDATGRARGDDPHRVRVGEEVALPERVGRVLQPAVVGIDGRECGVDTASREGCVCVRAGPFAHDEDIDPQLGELYRGAEPRPSRPDDEDRGGDPSLRILHRDGPLGRRSGASAGPASFQGCGPLRRRAHGLAEPVVDADLAEAGVVGDECALP
jgi:hypothetical protein